MATIRTKIMELLEQQGVKYRLMLHSEPVFTIEAAAAQRGIVKEEMVKSILLRESKGRRYVMGCVTGEARIEPQAVWTYLPGEWKRLTFATAEEILAVTGCVQGAVAPLGLPPEIPVIFDEAIARRARVSISSGDPGAGLELDSQALIKLAGARLAPIAQLPKEEA